MPDAIRIPQSTNYIQMKSLFIYELTAHKALLQLEST